MIAGLYKNTAFSEIVKNFFSGIISYMKKRKIMDTIELEPKHIPVAGSADVVVAGGGPAGVCAAIAAAEAGADTLLIEEAGCLGGVWTSGALAWILDAEDKPSGTLLARIVRTLRRRGELEFAGDGTPAFNIEAMKALLDEFCMEAGVKIRCYTRVTSARRSADGAIACLVTESKSGCEAWRGRVFIDCTGDGDLGAAAGNPFELGDPREHRTQPMSLLALLAGLDAAQMRPYLIRRGNWDEAADRFAALLCEGDYRPSYRGVALFHLGNGLFMLMANHQYGYSGISAADLTAASIAARREIGRQVRILKTRGPAWENVRLVATGARIGVREGRRLAGRYCVTLDDVMNGRRHPDGICRVRFAIDVHALYPDGGCKLEDAPPKAEFYEIPLRALIAGEVPNLLMAGRCISGDFFAHASYRVTGNAAVTGEAAGVLAALAARNRVFPGNVDYKEVIQEMKK